MTRITIVVVAALALAVTLPAAPAQAQIIRTFVSAAGSDSNPCTITQPCRHFQAAVNATAVGGEVDALDTGAYGSFTISHAITIEGQGWSYVAPPSNGNAITINAVSGNVTIHGVSLNGVGTSSTNGIVFNSGDSLTVTDCLAQNFAFDGTSPTTGNGILMQPTSGAVTFVIANTTVANNGFTGFSYFPLSGSAAAYGAIDHVVATNNFEDGFVIYSGGGSATVAISNSVASNNGYGIYVQSGGPLTVSIDNIGASNNVYGIWAQNTPTVLLGRSVITSNGTAGVDNNTSPNSFYSYQDNRINGNGTSAADDIKGTALNSNGLK